MKLGIERFVGLCFFMAGACHGAPSPSPKVVAPSPSLGRPEASVRPSPFVDGGCTLGLDERLDELAQTRVYHLGIPQSPHPTRDGRRVYFLRSGGKDSVQSLWAWEVNEKREQLVLSADSVVKGSKGESMSPEEEAHRERLRLRTSGFSSFQIDEGDRVALLPYGGRLFAFDLPRGPLRELPTGPGAALAARLSPDGQRVAYVRGHDVYTVGIHGEKERRLTQGGSEVLTHGLADFLAQEEFDRYEGLFWSPDSRSLLFEEVDSSAVERASLVDFSHPEREPVRPFYPRPGKPIPKLRFGMVSVRGGAPTWVDWDHDRFPYVANVAWTQEGPPTLVLLDRAQRNAHVLAVADPARARNGAQVILRATDSTWIEPRPSLPRWVPGQDRFLWISDTDEGSRLELHRRDGSLERTLTPPSLDVRRVLRLDLSTEGRPSVLVEASEEPSAQEVYRVALDGSKVEPLWSSEEPGYASVVYGKGEGLLVTSESFPSQATLHRVRNGAGVLLGELPSVALRPPCLRPIRVESVGAAANRTLVLRPQGYDPARRYPVIDAAYGGPGVNVVLKAASAYVFDQWLADATESIVVKLDTRGTPHRGRIWERALFGHLGSVPVEGHIEALRDLFAREPSMDSQRVGVTGWSFGGYFASYGVLKHPEVYRVGVAGAPPVDWQLYDAAYSERYLGDPRTTPETYGRASLLSAVEALREGAHQDSPSASARLLLVHGLRDDNVYVANSLALLSALERAQHSVEFYPIADATHGVTDPPTYAALWKKASTFLRGRLHGSR